MSLSKLDEPFPASDIEWRIQRSGSYGDNKIYAVALAYVTNRAIMNRLDEVAGKAGWRNEYQPAPAGGVMCGISIKVDGEWITKWDAAENTQVEAVKGGMSSAMKRAAVQWGIGRYLYNLEEGFAETSTERKPGWNQAKLKNDTRFYWKPPQLPLWALPSESASHPISSEPVRSPDEILAEFVAMAGKEESVEALTALYRAAWNALNTSKEHQEKCHEVMKTRHSEIKSSS